MKLFLFSLLLIVITACTDNDCGFDFAADQIRFADSAEKNGIKYYLYTRTVGFQEKNVFFELFDEKPIDYNTKFYR